MGTTYNAKLDVNCIKQHVCLGCQAEYQYSLERKVTGSGGTQEAAAANAEAAAIKALENDVDQHACPHCGMMQPDMVAEVRSSRFVAGMWIAPIVILVAFFLALPHVLTIATSAIVASVGVVISLLLFVSGVFFNPNKDMASAQMASGEKVQSGVLTLTKEGNTSTSDDDFTAPRGGHWFGLMLGGVALIAVVSPLALPVISGWEMNNTYPAIVGPGDETCVYFDSKIQSLKGMWYGSVSVEVTNAAELGGGPLSFRGTSKQSTWGDTISGKSVSNETHAMWVELEVPESPDLTGKSVSLNLAVSARYPYEEGGGFADRNGDFRHSTSLKLSGPGSGKTYWQSWIFGQLGAVLLILIAGIALGSTAKSLVQTANPPGIIIAGGDDDESADS